ncbi:SMF3 [Candida metapsilosis]|uniref:SMF3 n=1 Tax=Candida metapsilosis TaxID=273372 RepID=A0A8H7Z818_9ASCO|nr:SMF3 [Candida metapsilosis]
MHQAIKSIVQTFKKYLTFVGPGLVVSVSYLDPGNYSTSTSGGSMYQYKLCFVIFMSNIFAVILQTLCVKLGTITGLDLAEMCRLNLTPNWNLFMYLCAEIAIIATDLAEVVGTAISLEILFGIPLLYGVLITVLDVLIILMAYHKDGSLKQTKIFEILVSILVMATCVCFILELFKCPFEPGAGWEIFKGFLPVNKDIFREKNALFISCGIVGSTVMPHSLFLGSALVQPRLKDFDEKNGLKEEVLIDSDNVPPRAITSNATDDTSDVAASTPMSRLRSLSNGSMLVSKYKPSYEAIKYCLNYSYVELILSLFFVAVFVNSAILIVAGATLYGKPDAADADLLSIYEMLSRYISPAAGLLFALSMLFSGQSAGIVCTMAGQIVSEGFINWTIAPWKRRIMTRVIAIVPVLIVIGILGREGVNKVMNSSQVVLSFILPIVSAPLIYFTCKKKYMVVYRTDDVSDESSPLLSSNQNGGATLSKPVTYENGTLLQITSILTWIIITALNIYLIIAFANGADI